MRIRVLAAVMLAAMMVAGMMAGCQQPAAATNSGPILSVDMLRSRHAQAEFHGQVEMPMLLISWYPRAEAANMRILEHVWVDQKGHILKEWITRQGVERKEEQLTPGELAVVRKAIARLPGDMSGVADRDLLLVSYRDGMGPWTTRTYSKKKTPEEMLPRLFAVVEEGME